LRGAAEDDVIVKGFFYGDFLYAETEIEECVEELRTQVSADLILTHYREDVHQDHRLLSELS
jgi:LmbE family N-acetylglucosaminyl deacetylase